MASLSAAASHCEDAAATLPGSLMGKGRLEAFSDGVLAIIITIMVLELKVPRGDGLAALYPLCPVFFSYVLSFLYIGIYWNNHHHLMHTVKHPTAAIMWSNLHLLFWLSLLPVVTGWVGDNPDKPVPAALYGVVLLAAAGAWLVLQRAIIAGGGSLAQAIGADLKGKVSALLYAAGIALAFVQPWFAHAIFFLVALIWIVPDRRIERRAMVP